MFYLLIQKNSNTVHSTIELEPNQTSLNQNETSIHNQILDEKSKENQNLK